MNVRLLGLDWRSFKRNGKDDHGNSVKGNYSMEIWTHATYHPGKIQGRQEFRHFALYKLVKKYSLRGKICDTKQQARPSILKV